MNFHLFDYFHRCFLIRSFNEKEAEDQGEMERDKLEMERDKLEMGLKLTSSEIFSRILSIRIIFDRYTASMNFSFALVDWLLMLLLTMPFALR